MKQKITHLLALWEKQSYRIEKALFILFVIALLLVHFLTGAVQWILVQSGFWQQKSVTVRDFETYDIEIVSDKEIITKTNDARMFYRGNVKNLKFKCEFLHPYGEFNSFYVDALGNQHVQYAQYRNGYYVFSYPLGAKEVRVDFGINPSVTVQMDEILLNHFSFPEWIGFHNSELIFIFVIPFLFFFVVDTVRLLCLLCKKKKQ